MQEFLEIVKENWFEIITAIGTLVAIFITRGKAGKHLTKTEAEMKVAKLEKKVNKDIAKAKKDNEKLEAAKKELENVRSNTQTQ